MAAPVIDCDIHPGVPDIKALLPYMSDYWRDAFVDRGIDGFDMMSYPLGAPITCRPDWRVAGERPGSSLAQMRAHALDRFGIGLGHLQPADRRPGRGQRVDGRGDLLRRQRLDRGALAGQGPAPARLDRRAGRRRRSLAVEEIERLAGDRRFVQVLLPAACELMLGPQLLLADL